MAREVRALVRAGSLEQATAPLPVERPYPLPADIAEHLGATV